MTGIRRFDADQNIDLVYMREDTSGLDVEHLTIRPLVVRGSASSQFFRFAVDPLDLLIASTESKALLQAEDEGLRFLSIEPVSVSIRRVGGSQARCDVEVTWSAA